MLPIRNWKTDAVVRLLAAVFLCVIAGSVLVTVVAQIRLGQVNPRVLALGIPALLLLISAIVLTRYPLDDAHFVHRVWPLAICFNGGLFLAYFTQLKAGVPGASVAQMVISALSFQGAALVLVGRFLREHDLSPGDAFGLDHKVVESVLYGVAVACVFLPLAWGLQWLSSEVMGRLMGPSAPVQQQAVQTLRLASGLSERFLLGIVTILLAPLAEELLFRGVIYSYLRQLGFRQTALWGSSILFALIHLNAMSFVALLVFALLLAVLYERTGNLLSSISAHALFNAMNFVTLYIQQRLGQ